MAERLSEGEREALHRPHRVTINPSFRGCPLCTDYIAAVEALLTTRLAPIEALAEEPCELYDKPGQDCITAGPEVFAADGCMPCRLRAALAASRPVHPAGEVGDSGGQP